MTKEKIEYTHIFDDVFRTMEEHTPELLIPLINEVFKTNYPPDVKITRLGDRHHRLGKPNETDSALEIGQKIYHLECESNSENGNISIRMLEYDMSVALDTMKKENGTYVVELPSSGVIYLRHNENTKDEERVILRAADGKEFYYTVPVIKSQSYSKEDIFEKQLYLLLPYYILKYEKQLSKMEQDEELREVLLKDYEDIIKRLVQDIGNQRPELYAELYDLMQKVLNYTLRKSRDVKKGVEQIMGGQILESYRERVLREGHNAGLAEGHNAGLAEGKLAALISLVQDGLLPVETAAERAELSIKEFQELYQKEV